MNIDDRMEIVLMNDIIIVTTQVNVNKFFTSNTINFKICKQKLDSRTKENKRA